MSVVSVSSSSSIPAGKPNSASACRMSFSSASGVLNCNDETFTAMITGGMPVSRQALGWRQASQSTPVAKSHDQAVALCHREEIRGRDDAPRGRAPADRSLDADDSAGGALDLRLIFHKDLFRADGGAQIVAQADARAHLGVHRIGEEAIGAPPFGLGAVKRYVCPSQQRFRVGGIGSEDGNTDADAASDLVAADDVWLVQAGEEPPRHEAGLVRVLDAGLHDGEFVAAEAGDGVAVAHGTAQSLGHQLEECVADRMSQRIVDVLEVIEVEIEHGKACRA